MKKKLNKKKILYYVLIVEIIFLVIVYFIQIRGNSKMLFGIDEENYKILKKENKLSLFDYGGEYYVKMEVKENQLETIIKAIQECGYIYADLEEHGDITKYKKQVEYYESKVNGIVNQRLRDAGILYYYGGDTRRFVLGAREPRCTYSFVEITKKDDRLYEVCLYYVE